MERVRRDTQVSIHRGVVEVVQSAIEGHYSGGGDNRGEKAYCTASKGNWVLSQLTR